jgi:hypothetical protein
LLAPGRSLWSALNFRAGSEISTLSMLSIPTPGPVSVNRHFSLGLIMIPGSARVLATPDGQK